MNNNEVIITIIFSTIVLLLIFVGFTSTVFISKKNQLQQKLKITELKLDLQKELRRAETEITESVMDHLSRELHDNLGHLLTHLRLKVGQTMLDYPHQQELLEPIEVLLQDFSQQLRMLSRTLNSDFILENGFNHALETEVNRIQQLNMFRISLKSDGIDPILTQDQQLMAFRIFQEIISNILRHSEAKKIDIDLKGEHYFHLQVSDNGKGFDVQEVMASNKINGIRNMIKRAGLSEMTYQIESEKGKGSKSLLTQNNKTEAS